MPTALSRAALTALSSVLPLRAPTAGPDETVRRAVVGGWLVLCGWAFAYVARYGVDGAYLDEWCVVRPLVGEENLWSWLWTRHNEHLYPLPRIVWWTLHQLTGLDFRAGMYFSAWALGTAAWLLLRVARTLRGSTRLADLTIPLLLLHSGYREILTDGYNLCFALPALLAAAWLRLVVGGERSAWRLILAGVAVATLALCGGGGLLFAPLFGLWLLVAAARAGWGATLAVLPAVVTAAGYFVWYAVGVPPPSPKATVEFAPTVIAASQYLAGALGRLGEWTWPVGFGVVLVAVGAGALSARRAVVDRARSWGATAVLAVLLGGAGVGASMAVARGWMSPTVGFGERYVAFSTQVVLAAYLLWVIGDPRPNRWIGWGGLIAAAVVFASATFGEAAADQSRYRLTVLRYDAEKCYDQTGHGIERLAGEHCDLLYVPTTDDRVRANMRDGLDVCRRHRIGCYRWLRTAGAP